jgi:low affinity Fe/Cu permease
MIKWARTGVLVLFTAYLVGQPLVSTPKAFVIWLGAVILMYGAPPLVAWTRRRRIRRT